jgi:lysophospholipase L1-like esterase
MMRVTLLVCLLSFCHSAKADEQPANILLIGDSLAYGLARPLAAEAKKHNAIVHSNAIGGTNTRQWAKLKPWLIHSLDKWHPQWVFVVLGTNDYGVPTWRKQFGEHAEIVVKKIHEHHAKVVWLTPPRIKINTNFIYFGATASDAESVFDYRTTDIPLWEDRIHPSFKGDQQWSEMIMARFDAEVRNGNKESSNEDKEKGPQTAQNSAGSEEEDCNCSCY